MTGPRGCACLLICLAAWTGLPARGQQPEGGKAKRLDLYGRPLPPGALVRMGTVWPASEKDVYFVAFSPDGKALASASLDRAVRLWDISTGRLLRTLDGHGWGVASVAFSPDGKVLASAGLDKTVRLWDMASGKELRRLTGPKDFVLSVAFSPDGKVLAYSGDPGIHLLCLATGKELARPAGHGGRVISIAFSPDGKALASGGADKTVRLWDVSTGKERLKLEGHEREVTRLAFSPDGKALASGSYDGTVRAWDAGTGKELLKLLGHKDTVSSVAFSRDGKTLASSGHDKTIRLWDAATGKHLRTLLHEAKVNAVAFSPDGKALASASGPEFFRPAGGVMIRLWRPDTGKLLREFGEYEDRILAVAFAPDGRTVASGSTDGTLRLWEAATGKERLRLEAHGGEAVEAVAFSPDGKVLASGGGDGTIRLGDAATGKERRRLRGHEDGAVSLAFSPDGKSLASGGNGRAFLWDVAAGTKVRTYREGASMVAFSPDGKTLALGGHCLWDLAGDRKRLELVGVGSGGPVAFSPDGRAIISGGCLWSVWDTVTGRELIQFKDAGPGGGLCPAAFSPDGSVVALSDNASRRTAITIYAPFTAEALLKFAPPKGHAPGRETGFTSVAFSPDGKALAVGSENNTVLVWDVGSRLRGGRPQKAKFSAEELKVLWAELDGQDALKAYQAARALAGAPGQAVPLLKEHLRPAPRVASARLAQLIAHLGSDQFALREAATRELEQLGESAGPALREALARPGLSLEPYRRVERLLEKLAAQVLASGQPRKLRPIKALELIGTKEARQVLGSLAGGAPEARLTQEAKAALERLARRGPRP